MEEKRDRPFALHTLALIHEQEGSFEYAEVSLQEGIAIASELESFFIMAYLQQVYGRVLTKLGRQDEAVQMLSDALAKFEQMKIGIEVERTQAILDTISNK